MPASEAEDVHSACKCMQQCQCCHSTHGKRSCLDHTDVGRLIVPTSVAVNMLIIGKTSLH